MLSLRSMSCCPYDALHFHGGSCASTELLFVSLSSSTSLDVAPPGMRKGRGQCQVDDSCYEILSQ